MDLDDIIFCQNYFREEERREPTITEIRRWTPIGPIIAVTQPFSQPLTMSLYMTNL